MKIMKLMGITILVSYVFVVKSVDETLAFKAIDKLNGIELAQAIQNIGYSAFGDLNNFLKDDPEIALLDEDSLNNWGSFLLNAKIWIEVSKFDAKKRSDYLYDFNTLLVLSDIDAIGIFPQMITQIINRNPLNKEIFKKLLEDSLKKVTSVFLDSYKQLLPLVKKFPHNSAKNALDAYKKDSKNMNFSVDDLFEDYTSTFKTNADQPRDKNIVIALTLSNVFDGDETYEMQQRKVTALINLLEELVDKSKGYFSRYLTKDQIIVAQKIIDDLYSVYPTSNTYTSNVITTLATSKAVKPNFILWISSRILIVTLRAYLRKAEIL